MTANEVMQFFAKKTGFSIAKLKNVQIGSTVLTRPFLITLVEKLEKKTGIEILQDSDAPLRYLPETTTIGDIAEAFGNPETSRVVAVYKKLTPKIVYGPDVRVAYRETVMTAYREMLGKDVKEETLVVEAVSDGFTGDWEDELIALESKLNLQLWPNLKEWMDDANGKRTIKEVVTKCEELFFKD